MSDKEPGTARAASTAEGERHAIRGYLRQYDWIAERVYDSMLARDLLEVQLVNPEVGKVDDLLLVRSGRADGFQFKTESLPAYITFGDLVNPQRSRGGASRPALMAELTEGWKNLRRRWPLDEVRVHLVTNRLASVNDHLPVADHRAGQNFSAFYAEVLAPISKGDLKLSAVAPRWEPVLGVLVQVTGLSVEDLQVFLSALRIELGAATPLAALDDDRAPKEERARAADLDHLSRFLFRSVGQSPGPVALDVAQLKRKLGWQDRLELRSRHEFPLPSPDLYEPLEHAKDELVAAIDKYQGGYLAVTGSPGSGKSTLLTQTLSARSERVIRYYAYVPGASGSSVNRALAENFLHDIVVSLDRLGLRIDRALPASESSRMRDQLFEQLSQASEEFKKTGRKTILIVDGLDHVWREHTDLLSVLNELPKPEELPLGVILIVGSQTTEFLDARIRAQLEEASRVTDLTNQRLAFPAVLAICGRIGLSTMLPSGGVQRIHELSDGHPLALNYLINQLAALDNPGEIAQALSATVPFEGDIRQQYAAYWQHIERVEGLVRLLALIARLEGPIDIEWVQDWANVSALGELGRRYRHYFRVDALMRWRFFHDSFRQFIVERTAVNLVGDPDPTSDKRLRDELIDRISQSAANSPVRSEEIRQRYLAGRQEEMLALASLQELRRQYIQLRAPGAIRADILSCLKVAAETGDSQAMIRLILASAELDSRDTVLEQVDVSGVLLDVELLDEAIRYALDDVGGRAPLSQLIRTARRLHERGSPAGRQLFDLCEPAGSFFEEDASNPDETNSAAQEWARAAVIFRSLSRVKDLGQRLLRLSRNDRPGDRRWEHHREEVQRIGIAILVNACRELVAIGREAEAAQLVSILANHLADLGSDRESLPLTERDTVNAAAANTLSGLVRSQELRWQGARRASDDERVHRLIDETEGLFAAAAVFYHTDLLTLAAGALLVPGREDLAQRLLNHHQEPEPINSSNFSLHRNDVMEARLCYWRLRYQLALQPRVSDDPDHVNGVLAAVVPRQALVADEGSDPPSDRNAPLNALCLRIDEAIRELAKLQAMQKAGLRQPTELLPERLLALIDAYGAPPERRRYDISYQMAFDTRGTFVIWVIETAALFGPPILERLAEHIKRRFEEHKEAWPAHLRQKVVATTARVGFRMDNEAKILDEAEKVLLADTTITDRLSTAADQARLRAELNYLARAQQLARTLVETSFGIGQNKDNQLEYWVSALRKALRENAANARQETEWLAKLVAASMAGTEGLPARAGSQLPAALSEHEPTSAIRLFEYLTRKGALDIIDALADLVTTLCRQFGEGHQISVQMGCGILGKLLIPLARQEQSDALSGLLDAASRVGGGPLRASLRSQLRADAEALAPPTVRPAWLALLHDEPQTNTEKRKVDQDNEKALQLKDESWLTAAEVLELTRTVEGFIEVRQREAIGSFHDWTNVLRQTRFSVDDFERVATALEGSRRRGKALLELASQAASAGRREAAASLARHAITASDRTSWTWQLGTERRDAWRLLVDDLGKDSRRDARLDLAESLSLNRWLAASLLPDLTELIQLVAPELTASAVWHEIRAYLEGMLSGLELSEDDPSAPRPTRWWSEKEVGAITAFPNPGPGRDLDNAMAELAVDFLLLPLWAPREGAEHVLIQAIAAGSHDCIAPLLTVARPGSLPPHIEDLTEEAGRVLAAAAEKNQALRVDDWYLDLEAWWRRQPSWSLQSLARPQARAATALLRPVALVYEIALASSRPSILLPPGAIDRADETDFWPYEPELQIVAKATHVNAENLVERGRRTANDLRDLLPSPKHIEHLASAVGLEAPYIPPKMVAARIAYSRVVGQLQLDGVLTDQARSNLGTMLRSVDLRLMWEDPQPRPEEMPELPSVSYPMDEKAWTAEVAARLEQYCRRLDPEKGTNQTRHVLAATCTLAASDRPKLYEYYSCGTELRDPNADSARAGKTVWYSTIDSISRPPSVNAEFHLSSGDPLAVLQQGLTFLQHQSYWVALRPEVADAMGWTAAGTGWGRWLGPDGDVRVETIYWSDGVDGHTGGQICVGDGTLVVATPIALTELRQALGALERRHRIQRLTSERGSAPSGESEGNAPLPG